MIFDVLATLLIVSIICNIILMITNIKLLSLQQKHKRDKFIKKIEKDTEDLSVDVLIKELDEMDKKRKKYRLHTKGGSWSPWTN